MIPHSPITYIFWATIGAGFFFLVAVQPEAQQACEPVELVRFVGSQPAIHVIEQPTFGRSSGDWFQQFAEAEPKPEVVAADEDEPVRHHRRRRHGRW